jgi:hypothetical protein
MVPKSRRVSDIYVHLQSLPQSQYKSRGVADDVVGASGELPIGWWGTCVKRPHSSVGGTLRLIVPKSMAPSSHPLLAQIPLTVSPFISLPTATTLPYTWKPLPSTLPPSSTGVTANGSSNEEKPQYVVSSTGHAAHPDEIIASCRALQSHLQKLQEDAEKAVQQWEEGIRERELAEKRRVAPGWLDREERILEPERRETGETLRRVAQPAGGSVRIRNPSTPQGTGASATAAAEGDELDRAFGGLDIR